MIEDNGGNEEQRPPKLTIDLAHRAGVWANWARVSHSEHEFTIDFARLDPVARRSGIVVARVAMSPLVVARLMDTLQANWDTFVRKTMPREIRDADLSEGGEGNEEDESEEGEDPRHGS